MMASHENSGLPSADAGTTQPDTDETAALDASTRQIVSLLLPSHEVNLSELEDIPVSSEQQPQPVNIDAAFVQKDDAVLQQDPGQLVSGVEDHSKQLMMCKVTDGQPVQLEDGSMAYLHTTAREGSQPIQLEDGSTAYICQAPPDSYMNQTQPPPPPTQEEENLSAKVATTVGDLPKEGMAPENPSGMVKFTMSTDRIIQIADKSYRCSFENCGRLYTTLHHLKVHERSHTGDRPFRCDYAGCGKAFATGYGLKSHTRVHTGEKPYKCPETQCGKAFKTSGDLQKHIRIHTGERPFKCPFEGCDRAFTTSNIRKVHIRTHTGEKPYVCQEENCGRTFASATNYKNHIRIHTGEKPYVCTVEGCNKRFTEYSSLYKHHVVHTHQKPYVCNHCGKTYRQTSTLAMHKRTAHNEDTTPEMEAAYAQQQNPVEGPPMKRAHIDYNNQDEPREGALVINTSDSQQVTMVAGMTSEQTIAALQAGRLHSGQVVTVSTGEQGEQIYVVTDPSQLLQLGLQVEQQPMHQDQPNEDPHSQLSIVQPGETGDDIMQPLVQQ